MCRRPSSAAQPLVARPSPRSRLPVCLANGQFVVRHSVAMLNVQVLLPHPPNSRQRRTYLTKLCHSAHRSGHAQCRPARRTVRWRPVPHPPSSHITVQLRLPTVRHDSVFTQWHNGSTGSWDCVHGGTKEATTEHTLAAQLRDGASSDRNPPGPVMCSAPPRSLYHKQRSTGVCNSKPQPW